MFGKNICEGRDKGRIAIQIRWLILGFYLYISAPPQLLTPADIIGYIELDSIVFPIN